MKDLKLPIYIVQSDRGLLFAPRRRAMRYVKPGVTIFQAITAFQFDRPGVDDMRQTLGLAFADIDEENLKTVPELMRCWKGQEEGWAYIDSLEKAQRRRLEARKRRAIRRGMQQMREGTVDPDEETDTRLREIVDAQDERDSEKFAIIDEGLAEIRAGVPGIPNDVVLKMMDDIALQRFGKRGGKCE